jgi:hypothetical protein
LKSIVVISVVGVVGFSFGFYAGFKVNEPLDPPTIQIQHAPSEQTPTLSHLAVDR